MAFRLVRTITGIVGGDTGIIFSIVLDRHFAISLGQGAHRNGFCKALFLISHFGVVRLWVCSGDILSGQGYTS